MKDKHFIVTGASSGIGFSLCEKLISSGARVSGLCRRPSEVPEGVQGVECDLTDSDAIRSVFSGLSTVDGLVNNAGVALSSKITTGDLEDWDLMWKVNVRALALCSQLVLDKLSPHGQIVNISSMSGHRVPPGGGFYSPTKFAVRAISESLRLELRSIGSNVRISSVSPGFVDTPLLDDYFKGRESALLDTKANMKMLEAEDIADVISSILKSPQHVEIGDIQLRSVGQSI